MTTKPSSPYTGEETTFSKPKPAPAPQPVKK